MTEFQARPRTAQEAKRELAWAYTTPGHPLAFSSANAIYQHFDKVLSLKEINAFLQTQSTYTRHRENRRRAKFHPPFKSYFKRNVLQMDILDVSGVASVNDKIKFLLIVLEKAVYKSAMNGKKFTYAYLSRYR